MKSEPGPVGRIRAGGILLPVFSLDSPYGIGDFGLKAYSFLDFLVGAGQRYWQILPLHPTDPAFDHSPYHSLSAFALNPLFISPDLLFREGWIDRMDPDRSTHFKEGVVDYVAAFAFKEKVLETAWRRFKDIPHPPDYEEFKHKQASWLDDYALFAALKSRHKGRPWTEWPVDIRARNREALETACSELETEIEKVKFIQYLAHIQWTDLRSGARLRGIKIIGDMPIYVVHDSSDVWSSPELFRLEESLRPEAVAGVPPDYFSPTGQRWGNPLYRWDVLKERGYLWWLGRIERNLGLFDLLRIDHFRGLAGYWEIPAEEKTAVKGRWRKGPGQDLLEMIRSRWPDMPFIAEDLGTITPDVHALMDRFSLPGMKVLLFAFGDDNPDHPYLPHTYGRHSVVYTGTHDNNTTRGWFAEEADSRTRQRLFRYLNRTCGEEEVSRELIRLAVESPSDTALIPLQDLLGLGAEARINRPGTRSGNWRWRFKKGSLSDTLASDSRALLKTTGRCDPRD